MVEIFTPEVVAFFGVFIGVLCRTVFPYLQKTKEAAERKETITFDTSFAITGVIAFIESLIFTLLIVLNVPIENTLAPLWQFITAFTWAYTSNDVINRTVT